MADKKANVVMSFKSDGEVKLAQTVKELNTIMNTAAKQYRAQMSAMDSNASTTDRLASQQQKLSTQFEAAKSRTKMLTDEYNRMKSSGEANAAALTKQAGKVMDAERAENSLKSQLEKVNSQMTDQGQHANAAKDKLSELQKTAGLLESEQKKLDSEFAVQRKELGANASETDKMTLAQKQLKQQTELTDRYIGNLEKQLKETKSAYGENSREANEMAAKLNNAKTAVSGVEAEMRQMESTSKQSSSALGSFREKLSLGAVAGVASNAVTTLTGGIGNMVSQAAEASDAMQKFDSTMKFAGFGKDSIKTAGAAVKKYADDTVYDLNTVANTTAQLAANGVKDYTGLTEAAGNLNAVAGGNADTFGSVAMVLTQTAGAGKLTTENWNQLADAIPGASGKLQEAMKKNGAYTGNFRDAMTDGQITADEFNKAIKQLGMTDAAKEAATSTKTFEGAIGSLQANVVTGIQDIINQIGKANMTRMISTLSDGIVGALKLVVGALKTVSEHQTAFKALAVGVVAFFAAFKTISTITTVVKAIKSFNETVKLSKGVMKAFNAVMGINPFVLAIAAIVAVVAALVYFFTQTKTGKKVWKDFTKWLSETWKALAEKAKEIFNAITEFFRQWGPTILAVLGGPIGLLVKFIIDHWQQIKDTTSNVFNAIKSFLSNLWNGIKSAISNTVNGIKETVSGIWNAIKDTTSNVWNGIKSVTSSVWDGIKSVITSVVNSAKSVVTNVWNSIKSVTSSAWNGIKSITSSVWNGISSVISGVVNGIRNTISNVWGGIRNTTSNVWNGIKSAMTGPVEAAKNIIGGIIDRIKGFFSGIHLSLPRIHMPALPHFKLNGSFSLKPPSVPHLGVDWYAKGGIFTKPTIFGQGPNGLKGAGEAGPEAALPLNAETLGAIGKGIASNMPGQNNGPVYLQIDGQTFGQIVGPYVDQYMSVRANDLNYGRGY
ncbi:tape measure protein [Latilactobacillus curvatus]|uniref:tape measure protein n=1 Tax=Latilactobacillus curvatus TaxID=28038 RepID=UPI0023D9B0E0|nr:tape measure protein [Latilactobacillus curvatus]